MSTSGTGESSGYQVVEAYGPGRFRVSGTAHEQSIIVFPDRTIAWPVERFSDITENHFEPLIERADEIEILLLGCGTRMELVPRRLRDHLQVSGIVLEPMDSGAAARTFNLLLSEDRKVAAALIALPDEE